MPPPSSQKPAPPNKPQWDILPAPGSPRSPCLAPCKWPQCACHYWFAIRATPCTYCDLPLGNVPCGILIWDSGNVAHQACQEEYFELEELWLHNPDAVEPAVRKAKLTMQDFGQLPSWERRRLVLPELEAACPDWQTASANNSAKTEIPTKTKSKAMLKYDSYSPNIDYAHQLDDLYKCGARCDAWRAFFQSATLAKLRKLTASVIWFSQHEDFDRLICEFDCPEKQLRQTLEAMRLPAKPPAITFLRDDIYDARAWCRLPLSYFIPIPISSGSAGFHARTHDGTHPGDVLKHNQMPVLQLGLKLPWTVTRDCFTLTHRLHAGRRFALMTFAHPQLDPLFAGKRRAASRMFPRETTRPQMEAVLMAQVEAKAAQSLVTITPAPQPRP